MRSERARVESAGMRCKRESGGPKVTASVWSVDALVSDRVAVVIRNDVKTEGTDFVR
jgi:hypothetical protein